MIRSNWAQHCGLTQTLLPGGIFFFFFVNGGEIYILWNPHILNVKFDELWQLQISLEPCLLKYRTFLSPQKDPLCNNSVNSIAPHPHPTGNHYGFLSPEISLSIVELHINLIIPYILLYLAPFTKHESLAVLSCCRMYQWFVPFCCWRVFHCLFISQLFLSILLMFFFSVVFIFQPFFIFFIFEPLWIKWNYYEHSSLHFLCTYVFIFLGKYLKVEFLVME